jgi:RNA recognition motif-containing protein
MAALFHTEEAPQMVCWDRKYYKTFEDQLEVLKTSKTVYVGNLSFFTTELQIQETFSIVGPIKRIIMGLNRNTKTPCGFCFVEYYSREHAAAALKYVSGTICDDRIIRCDMDGGFRPGRQYGRGQSGGQIRDERRENYDPARGGPSASTQLLLHKGLSSRRDGRPPEPAPKPAETKATGKRDRNSNPVSKTTTEELLEHGLTSKRGSSKPVPSTNPPPSAASADNEEEATSKETAPDQEDTSNDNAAADNNEEREESNAKRSRTEEPSESS